jgi:hypothetical protein
MSWRAQIKERQISILLKDIIDTVVNDVEKVNSSTNALQHGGGNGNEPEDVVFQWQEL